MGAYLTGFKKTDLRCQLVPKMGSGRRARDIIGLSGKQYLLNNVKVYGNARYDITAEVFNEVQGGVKFYPLSNLIFTGEYYQSYATFDTTSFYSVFAVNKYQRRHTRVDYTINDKVSVYGGYNRQILRRRRTCQCLSRGSFPATHRAAQSQP